MAEIKYPIYIEIARIEEQMAELELAIISQVPINVDVVEPRPVDCCGIGLSNVKRTSHLLVLPPSYTCTT